MRNLMFVMRIAVICATAPVIAQEEVKWGKIPASDLAMTTYLQDPEAGAIVLSDIGNVEFELRSEDRPIRKERHVRIKFLTQAGIEEYGDVKIRYYSYENSEVVTGLKAQVFLPDGKEIPVSSSAIFSTQENERWKSETIAFPGLVPGAIVEYRYTLMSDDLFAPVDWYFQREIPVVLSDLSVTIPHWFEYVVLQQGRPVDDQQVSKTKAVDTYGGTGIEYTKIRYICRDVEGLREEQFITTMDDYRARVRYQLKEVNSPSKPRRFVLETWTKVEDELLNREYFGKAVAAPGAGMRILEFAGMQSPVSGSKLDQAKKLYYYLSTNLAWNDRYSVFFRESVDNVLRRKEGTSGELNLVLVAGLRAMGIDAFPLLTSTRSHGHVIELYPILDQFNHTMAVAEIEGKTYLLDVGKGRAFGFPRVNALNYRGWKIEKDSSEWIHMIPEMSQSTYFMKMVCTPEGHLKGTLQGKFTGYHGMNERSAYLDDNATYFKGKLKAGAHTVSVDAFEFQNKEDIDMPWAFTANINAESTTETTDFMYLSMPVIEALTTNPFNAEKRNFPIEFHYPYAYKFVIDIQLPEGYVVEALPADKILKTEDGGITFVYRCSENQGRIQAKIDFGVSNLRYAPELYGMLKLMYDQITAVTGEQIVLKRQT